MPGVKFHFNQFYITFATEIEMKKLSLFSKFLFIAQLT